MHDELEDIELNESPVDELEDAELEAEEPGKSEQDELLEPIRMTRKFTEVPVTLENEQGVEKTYCLRELGGDDRDEYVNAMGQRAKYSDDGSPVGLQDYRGIQANLIAKSLHGATLSEDGKRVVKVGPRVKIEVIQSFPSRVQTALSKRIKAISGMDDEAEEKAKND